MPSESEVTPLVSYRASAEGFLRWEHSDRVVTGLHEIHSQAAERPPNSFWTASCASLGLS